jgi:hypothetical protein
MKRNILFRVARPFINYSNPLKKFIPLAIVAICGCESNNGPSNAQSKTDSSTKDDSTSQAASPIRAQNGFGEFYILKLSKAQLDNLLKVNPHKAKKIFFHLVVSSGTLTLLARSGKKDRDGYNLRDELLDTTPTKIPIPKDTVILSGFETKNDKTMDTLRAYRNAAIDYIYFKPDFFDTLGRTYLRYLILSDPNKVGTSQPDANYINPCPPYHSN